MREGCTARQPEKADNACEQCSEHGSLPETVAGSPQAELPTLDDLLQ